MPELHTPAPAFTLPDKDGNERSLSDFRGKKVIIYFYSRDNTSGCTRQANAFAALYDEFKAVNAEVIGISRDSVASHAKFKKLYGKVSMGVVRTTFLLDENGEIIKIMKRVKPDTNAADVLKFLKAL